MSQDLVSLKITATELASMQAARKVIDDILQRGTSLTPEQRRSLVKMGDGSQVFCKEAIVGLQDNASSLPADFALADLQEDFADYAALNAFATDYASTGERLDDTLKALSSDIMTNCLVGVAFLKALNKLKPSLDTLLANLSGLRRRKAAKKATPTA